MSPEEVWGSYPPRTAPGLPGGCASRPRLLAPHVREDHHDLTLSLVARIEPDVGHPLRGPLGQGLAQLAEARGRHLGKPLHSEREALPRTRRLEALRRRL